MNPFRYTFILLAFSSPAAAQRHAAIVTLPGPASAARAPAARTANARLAGTGHWLLVYLSADQPLDAQTALFLARLHADHPKARIAVLIDRPQPLAEQYVHDHASAAIREWHPDADHFYWTALALAGSPVLMGMEDDRVIWREERMVAQNRPLQAQIVDWLKTPVTETAAPATTSVRPTSVAPAAPGADGPDTPPSSPAP